MSSLADSTTALPAVDPAVAQQAARWLAHLYSEEANPADWQAFEAWRAESPSHEAAWRRAERVGQQLGVIPRQFGTATLLSASERVATRTHSRRKLVTSLALLIMAAPAGMLGYQHLPWRSWTADERSPTGQIRDLWLPDGSQVFLDTSSAINIVFDPAVRQIELRAGAILVQTSANGDARPFLVDSPAGRLRALGTRFVARLQPDGCCLVQVMQGAVELQPRMRSARPTIIPAGEQAMLTPTGTGPSEPVPADADSWGNGILYAERMRLDVFLQEIARYRTGLLRCDPEIGHLLVSGAFQLRDTDAILATLQDALPIAIHRRSRYWILVGPAQA